MVDTSKTQDCVFKNMHSLFIYRNQNYSSRSLRSIDRKVIRYHSTEKHLRSHQIKHKCIPFFLINNNYTDRWLNSL